MTRWKKRTRIREPLLMTHTQTQARKNRKREGELENGRPESAHSNGWWLLVDENTLYDFGSPNISSWENWIYVIMIIDVVVGVFRLFCLTFLVLFRSVHWLCDRGRIFSRRCRFVVVFFSIWFKSFSVDYCGKYFARFFVTFAQLERVVHTLENPNNMTNGLVGMWLMTD